MMKHICARVAVGLLVLALGCTPAPDVGFEPQADPTSEADAVAWRHLQHVETTLPGRAAAAAVTDPRELRDAWDEHDFKGEPPPVDFTDRVVLLLAQPDDLCPDELIGLEVVEGALEAEWLPPPGVCEQPLLYRLHAVEVHRGHVPASFEVAIRKPFDEDFEPTRITLPAYTGANAPAPPEPPRAMTAQQLDAVFDGHSVRRCAPADVALDHVPVDGPLSDNRKVAQAQRERATVGVPSDEATTRTVMDSPDRTDEYGLPLLRSEHARHLEATRLTHQVVPWLRAQGWQPDRDFSATVERDARFRPLLRLAPQQVEALQERIDGRFGVGLVVVEPWQYDLRAVADAERRLHSLLRGTGPGTIVSSYRNPAPIIIQMVDPTREALDTIAATVDPGLVCVEPALSGVPVRSE